MAVKPIICPVCGSSKLTGYFYGQQEEYDEAMKVMTKNPPLYGGNTMTPDTPMYHCKDCAVMTGIFRISIPLAVKQIKSQRGCVVWWMI